MKRFFESQQIKERTNNLATICDSKGNISVRDKTFTYPAAVVTGSDQVGAFNTLAQHLLRQTEQGYSCTLIAYGQTGSGKTYTMLGSPAEPGLIPRVCQYLFSQIDNIQKNSNKYYINEKFK